MRGYRNVPNSQEGTINEDEAVRGKGLKVFIAAAPKDKNKAQPRSFTVESLDTPSLFTIRKVVMLVLVCTCLSALIGGLFMKVGAPRMIEHYLNYPASNCTIVNATYTKDSNTESGGNGHYDLVIEYYDTKNESHMNKMKASKDRYEDRHWMIGSVFTCVHKGSFVIDKQTLDTEHSTTESFWFLGLVIPLATSALYSGIFEGQGATASTLAQWTMMATLFDILKINEWGPIPSNLRQYFYILMHSYYSKENASERNISFKKPLRDLSALLKGAFLFIGAFCVIGMFLMMGLAVYLMDGYSFVIYCVGLHIATTSLVLVAMAIFCFRFGMMTRSMVMTDDLFIQYSVYNGGITGLISVIAITPSELINNKV